MTAPDEDLLRMTFGDDDGSVSKDEVLRFFAGHARPRRDG